MTNSSTQSHYGTHAFKTTNKSFNNVKPQFVLATRKICTEHSRNSGFLYVVPSSLCIPSPEVPFP